jgi:hypothetical protein
MFLSGTRLEPERAGMRATQLGEEGGFKEFMAFLEFVGFF